MIINAYGLHWKPEEIFKKIKGIPSRKRFYGKVKRNKRYYEIDFWKARGVYALFKSFELVYVGKVPNMSLGSRIRNHWRNMGEHWDSFSFYCFSDIDFKNNTTISPQKALKTDKDTAIRTFEAIMINSSEPFLNKQEARLPKAKKATQLKYLEVITNNDILKKLNEIEIILSKMKRTN